MVALTEFQIISFRYLRALVWRLPPIQTPVGSHLPAPSPLPDHMLPLPGAQPQTVCQLRLKGDEENLTRGDLLLSRADSFESKDTNSKQNRISKFIWSEASREEGSRQA